MSFGCSNGVFSCSGGGNSVNKIQMVYSHLGLEQTVSIVGSFWAPDITQDLGLTQTYSDFFSDGPQDGLVLSQEAVAGVCRPLSIQDELFLADSFTSSGFLCCGDGDDPGQLLDANYETDSTTGRPIYITVAGNARHADASDLSTAIVAGLTYGTVANGSLGQYSTDGNMRQDDWSAVTGSANLISGRRYYLDQANPGMLTAVSPTTDGEVVTVVGHATDNKTLSIEIQTPVLL